MWAETSICTYAPGSNVVLDTLDVDGSIAVNAPSSNNVILVNVGDVNLGSSTFGNRFTVTSNTGDITDAGTIDIGGRGRFYASGDVVLDTLAVDGVFCCSSEAVVPPSITMMR